MTDAKPQPASRKPCPETEYINILSPSYDVEFDDASDKLYHLVQDEDLIAHIHNEELPPDAYYHELENVLA